MPQSRPPTPHANRPIRDNKEEVKRREIGERKRRGTKIKPLIERLMESEFCLLSLFLPFKKNHRTTTHGIGILSLATFSAFLGYIMTSCCINGHC